MAKDLNMSYSTVLDCQRNPTLFYSFTAYHNMQNDHIQLYNLNCWYYSTLYDYMYEATLTYANIF